VLDFAIERRDVAVQCDYFPPDLVRIAGELGIGLMPSLYPAAGDTDDEDATADA
jgi:hypothetical protein